jgi:hypothetical protein
MKKYEVSEIIEWQTIYHETVADPELVQNIYSKSEKNFWKKKRYFFRIILIVLFWTVLMFIIKPELPWQISNNIKNLILNNFTSSGQIQDSLTSSWLDSLSWTNEEKIMYEIEKMVESLSDSK